MKKIYLLLLILFILIIILAVFLFLQDKGQKENAGDLKSEQTSVSIENQEESNLMNNIDLIDFGQPLTRINEREIKKTFGIYITPQNSPIQPERFTGYHTGVDFEILPEELNKDVLVYAICSGELKLKQFGSGYGGMLVQVCQLNEEPVTVVYGHLKLSSVVNNIRDNIDIGNKIGLLGNDKSSETDYERKHLHISIHKGSEINTRGYVGRQAELVNWIDPLIYITKLEDSNLDNWEMADSVEKKQPNYVNLEVPYIHETPENIWTGSWKNGCEEAVIAMVEKYYKGIKNVSIAEAKEYMQMLFDFQIEIYGSDANSDVKRTYEIIRDQTFFGAKIVENPTVEDIKKELSEGRPVIGFHYGFDLENKNIPFLSTGSGYHTTVIKGYDEAKRQFITNDPGDSKAGLNHLYDYDIYMNSLHDYNYVTNQADGLPRILFTFRKN